MMLIHSYFPGSQNHQHMSSRGKNILAKDETNSEYFMKISNAIRLFFLLLILF